MNFVAIAGGFAFSLAVSNGHVYAWGDNNYGELGTNTYNNGNAGTLSTPHLVSGISNAVLVAAAPSGYINSGAHSMAMTVDHGTNHYWGWGEVTPNYVPT